MHTQRNTSRRPGVPRLGPGLIALGCAWLLGGCVPLEGGSSTSVSGTVLGQRFSAFSGVAEAQGASYLITLTDSSLYTCDSTPSGDYLQVVWEVEEAGTYDAAGNVSFSSVEGAVAPTEAATDGTVTVSSLDEAAGRIQGSLEAQGPDSQVSGSFDVEICP